MLTEGLYLCSCGHSGAVGAKRHRMPCARLSLLVNQWRYIAPLLQRLASSFFSDLP